MGITLTPTAGYTALFNDVGGLVPSNGINPLLNHTVPNFVLSYWYKTTYIPVFGATIFACRGIPPDRKAILVVSHLPGGKIGIEMGDSLGSSVVVLSTLAPIRTDGYWHNVLITGSIIGGWGNGSRTYGQSLAVLHDRQRIAPFIYASGNLIGSSSIPWLGASFAVGADIWSPVSLPGPYTGSLSEIFFTPLFGNPIPPVNLVYLPDVDRLGSGQLPSRLAKMAHLVLESQDTYEIDGIPEPGPIYYYAGYLGMDGETVFAMGPNVRFTYPNAGVPGIPTWGCPPVYLHGPTLFEPGTFEYNHAFPYSFLGWGSKMPGSIFSRYNRGGIVTASDDDPPYG